MPPAVIHYNGLPAAMEHRQLQLTRSPTCKRATCCAGSLSHLGAHVVGQPTAVTSSPLHGFTNTGAKHHLLASATRLSVSKLHRHLSEHSECDATPYTGPVSGLISGMFLQVLSAQPSVSMLGNHQPADRHVKLHGLAPV